VVEAGLDFIEWLYSRNLQHVQFFQEKKYL
jgi:hypothetical protein